MDKPRKISLGDVAIEFTGRAGCNVEDIPVFGVDKKVGITTEPRYQSKDLSRYKVIKPGMFGYNPMRLNIGSIGFCTERHGTGLISPDYVVFGCDNVQLLPEFLYYHTCSTPWKAWLELAGEGSVRERIYFKKLAAYTFLLPSISYQHAAVNILGTLDDKIELNRRMNETLEAMARALFKSWFVDFEPVRAKAEGRGTGLPRDIADLFTASFDDSELGEVPKGWRVGKFVDVATLSRSGLNPSVFEDELFDHYSLPAFDEGCTPKLDVGQSIKSNKFVVSPDSVLVSKLNPRIPRVWLPLTHNSRRSICSTEFLVLLPTNGNSREFLYCLLSNDIFTKEFATLVTGTSGSHQRVKPESLLTLNVVLPPIPLIHLFTTQVTPMLQRINKNIAEIRTLATLRDTLLPKLLSGEIRVKDAEVIVKETI
ncbi:MAG TPA: restriction endonuclease subunit S [Desulfuromonadales bacterium]|nr:restriction endonuclease subunit S [Desulfuromonadales bacterium]